MTAPRLEMGLLVDAACERVGSDNFGNDTWQEGLTVLIESLNVEAHLNDLGREVFTDQLVDYLANRLEIEQWYRQNPEIDDQDITAPLFGLGLPRTGSTALSFLLAQDSNRRTLRTWEAARPCPPPESASEHSDPRIAEAQAGIDLTNAMFPDFVGMLPTSAIGPQECLLVMAMDFRSQVFEGMAFVPSYSAWLMHCDMVPAYQLHQRVLKLLQWRCPPTRWWLKSPAHMHSIQALNAVYPSARFIITHRSVTKVLPSVCALTEALSTVLSEQPDPLLLGPHNAALWAEALHRFIAFRDGSDPARFFDVSFDDMQTNPLAAVDWLYGALGDELSAQTRHQMQDWWDANLTQRHSSSARPERFGLTPSMLQEQFAFYHERFGITEGDHADA